VTPHDGPAAVGLIDGDAAPQVLSTGWSSPTWLTVAAGPATTAPQPATFCETGLLAQRRPRPSGCVGTNADE
jgi:hypothetical protein